MSYFFGALVAYLLDPFIWVASYLCLKFLPFKNRAIAFIGAYFSGMLMSILVIVTLGIDFNIIRLLAIAIIAGVLTKFVKPKQK